MQKAMTLARGGRAEYVIFRAAQAAPAELYAVEELARWLKATSGATFNVQVGGKVPKKALVVMNDPHYDDEEYVHLRKDEQLYLLGGQYRGVLYAVYKFLQDEVGVRWWVPWATDVPKKPTLTVAGKSKREKPAFESRNPFWYPAFNADWAVRNFSNAQDAHLDKRHGESVLYSGPSFVHTFYPFVSPKQHFSQHPEWFSEVEGKRTVDRAQLCTTNPELREFLVAQVRAQLKKQPEARILSISQNDWYKPCTCPTCKAIDDAEGSYSGTLLALVNFIAERLEKEFPQVAFDTLAYQYTRKAPKTLTPRPNVIVRLCSIECNFRASLESPANKSFADDIRAWSQKSKRLYIWDYTTNFGHYCLPHPNWFTLGPNVRFFHQHGVRGVFEQGAYQSNGGEMAEMRAWVLAQLLWNPYQNDKKLIAEFVEGYYGKAAAPSILTYLDELYAAAEGFNLTCFSAPNGPHLSLKNLARAEQLWRNAENDTARSEPEKLWRVKQGRNAIRYAILIGWARLKKEQAPMRGGWPFGECAELAQQWLDVATSTKNAPMGWQAMTHVNEGGLTPQVFAERFLATERPDPTPLPDDLPKSSDTISLQEGLVSLFERGTLSEIKPDPKASNKKAVWMPGIHHEWAYQLRLEAVPERLFTGKWTAWIVVRGETGPSTLLDEVAVTAGVYDAGEKTSRAEVRIKASQVQKGYVTVKLGTISPNAEMYVWAAPAVEAHIGAVWVDRVIFTR